MAITRSKRPDTFSLNGSAQIGYSGGDEYFEVIEFYTSLLDGQDVSVSSCSFTAGFRAAEGISYPSSLTVHCVARGYGWDGGERWQSEQTFNWNPMEQTQHTFRFSNVGTQAVREISFELYASDGVFAFGGIISNAVAGYTFTPPTLGLSVTPSSLYVGGTITGEISEPLGQSISVRFAYNSTELESFSTSSSSFTQTAYESWFTRAGVTGSSMQVTVSISDSLGRTASARVTVNKHTALVPSIVQPRSGSYNGGESILFSWSSSGDGTQEEGELQYSRDNVSWSSLTYVNSETSWTAGGGFFPSGTVYWQIRLKNSWGIWSDWVGASFGVVYNGAAVTLTTPTSGSVNGGQEIAFAWTITAGSGSINGTQWDYSSDNGLSWTRIIDTSQQVTSYTAPAGTFPAGPLKWRVRASDNYSGWGAWKEATITISYAPAVVTLTAPTSGTKDGGQPIQFVWQIARGAGEVNGTQAIYSTDGGITWGELVVQPAEITSYTAPAGKFPAGPIIWKVRAQDQYAGMGDYKQATITIRYTPATVTLTTPTSGRWDGAESINFAWTVAAGSGSITGTQMEYSTDDGISWQPLIDSAETVRSYSASVAQFPAGPLLWQVRAEDSYSGWGAWEQASITVAYSAVSQAVPVNSPTSGVYNAAAARTFTVRLDPSSPVHDPFTVSAATFYWRHGESGAYNEVSMTPGGNTASVTIAAGTIPSGLFQWYASATDNTGRTTQTETYSLTALQTQIEAAPLSPVNTVESGSGPIPFRWTYGSLDGSRQGRAQLQYSTDGTTWSDEHIFADITGEDTVYVAPAGTIPGGKISWRVRAYNEAGTAGPWSTAASFTSYAAPIIQGVTGDGKPFATISWQTEGQEAYEIQVDERTYGPYFGADVRSYTLPETLEDGTHVVRVRAQNRYGLWSEWVSAEMSVTNVPTESLWIMADEGVNVHLRVFLGTLAPTILKQPQDAQGTSGQIYFSLSLATTQPGTTVFGQRQWYIKDPGGDWQPFSGTGATGSAMHFTAAQALDGRQVRCRVYNDVGEVYSRTATYHYAAPNIKIGEAISGEFHAETGYFLVYRDGVLIGKTYDTFDDRTALGEHSYSYVQVLPGGYYNRDTTTAAASVKCPMIAPLEGGDFLALALSENMDRTTQVQLQQEVAWTQYAGAQYPTPEIGEARRKTISLDVSALMEDEAFAKAFGALVGQDVIVKTPDGEVVIGPLEGYDLRAPWSHRAWTFSVQQMEWRDFVDES